MKYHRHLVQACVDALGAIFFEDRHADKCIEFYLKKNKKWGSRDRRFFAETVYDCVRWWRLDWEIQKEKQPLNPIPMGFLAASLIRRDLPFPDWVEFKNQDALQLRSQIEKIQSPALRQAFPDWLFDLCAEQLGPVWEDMAPYLNQTNSLVLRANTQKTDVLSLIKELQKEGVEGQRLLGTETGVLIAKRCNIFRTEAFKKGLFEVQDGSSQQVAPFMDIEPGLRVIDACAGAGGKTLHIADLLQNRGKVISMDIHQWKLDQLKLRARRNSYSNIEWKLIEGSKSIKRLKDKADRLLLDVPCSGLGVLRRNPDTKWKLSEQGLSEVIGLQAKLLQEYSSMLKPGGKLLYSTCSILPCENEDQVRSFLKSNRQFALLKQRHLYPTRDGYDGFYMALLLKSTDGNMNGEI